MKLQSYLNTNTSALVLNRNSNYMITGYDETAHQHVLERLMELGLVLLQNVCYQGQVSWNGAHLIQVENSVVALRDEEFRCLRLKNQ